MDPFPPPRGDGGACRAGLWAADRSGGSCTSRASTRAREAPPRPHLFQAPARPPPTWGGNLSPFEPPAPDGFPPLIRGPEAPPRFEMQTRLSWGRGPGAIKGWVGRRPRAASSGELCSPGRPAAAAPGPSMRGGPCGHHVRGLCAGQGLSRVPRARQAPEPRPEPASLRAPTAGTPAVPGLHRLLSCGAGPGASCGLERTLFGAQGRLGRRLWPGPRGPGCQPGPAGIRAPSGL